jgi:BatD DUF11 like domain
VRRFIVLLGAALALAAVSDVLAQGAAVHSEVEARKVGVEDVVEWSLVLEGPAAQLSEEVAVPPLKNLKVVGGPAVSTQISIVNAQSSQKKTYTWVLQPLATGTAEIGAVRVKFVGGEATAPAVTIEVSPGRLKPRAGARTQSPFGPDPFGADPFEDLLGSRRRPSAEGKLFISAVPSRTRVRVGEAVLVTYFIYARGVQPTAIESVGTPQYPGFWAESVESKENLREEQVTMNGEVYVRFPVHRRLLFPTKAGTLTIPAMTLRIALARQSVFDQGLVAERSTQPIKLTVDPLPDEPGFTGAVGSFKIEATADPTSLLLGDAATVRFRVEGVGNLKWVDKGPEFSLPGAKVFPPQVKSNVAVRPEGLAGSKTWEYVVVPETSGRLSVPALAFAWFDPEAGRIHRAETAPLELEVRAGATAGGLPGPAAAVSPRGVSALALRDAIDPPRGPLPALSSRALLFVLLGTALAHTGLFLVGRVPGLARVASASSQGRSALKHLKRAAEPGMAKEQAAALIERALQEAFAGTEDGKDGGSDPERERVVSHLLEEVHLVRYAPQLGDYSEKLRDLARRAREAVERWA